MGVGGGGCMYVPSLTFRIMRRRPYPLSYIESIFILFVAILSGLMSLFQGHFDCQNFTLAEPHGIVCHQLNNNTMYPKESYCFISVFFYVLAPVPTVIAKRFCEDFSSNASK